MKAKLARFYPSSLGLAARIGFILIGAVVLSVGISTAFIFIVGEGRDHMPMIPAETLAEKILAVYRRIDTTPAGARDTASTQAEAPILRIDWPAPPRPPGRTPPPGYLRDLRTFIQLGLHDPTRGVAVGMSFPPGFGEGLPPGEPPEGQAPEGQPPEGQPPGGRDRRGLSRGPRRPTAVHPASSSRVGWLKADSPGQGSPSSGRRSGSRCSSATGAGLPSKPPNGGPCPSR